ncbi:MAG: EAL domain-containing protein [Acidobacteria bacterium]|nr:EAL domain-containing protein [Acidobacteriota bacterium]
MIPLPLLSPSIQNFTRRTVRLLRTRVFQYSLAGFLLGLALTVSGYLVDYFALYQALPERFSFTLIRGLHEVTPVHFFSDGFALLLGVVGGIAGRLQDKVLFYSTHLEELVDSRTHALRRSEERYALAARGANDGLWDWDLVKEEVYYSPRWKQNLGYRKDEVGTSPEDWLGRVHPKDRKRVKARIEGHLRDATSNFSVEYRIRHADGSYRWTLARGMAVRSKEDGKPYRMAGSQTDIDERKKMEQQLMFMALHDSLTSLPNRTLFLDRLDHAFARARKHGSRNSLAVFFLDVDRFKNVNDSLGHLKADQLLVMVSKRIKECLERFSADSPVRDRGRSVRGDRPGFSWTLARMGGDEFTVLLEDIDSLHDATRVVKEVEESFRNPMILEGRKLFITLSTGIVLGPSGYERAGDLLRDADTAMYRAKANGRARFEIFDQRMLAKVQDLLRLETDLHQAVERGEIRVAYQPILDLEKGALVGFEALGRWHHKERGWIPPDEFIPLAEESGLALELGHSIFSEVCRQMRAWGRENPLTGGLTFGINISPKQFFDPKFLSNVQAEIRKFGQDPRRIYFEITENTLISDPEEARKLLARMKKTGFRMAIDDFGTGYSSLSQLQNLPVEILKIDQSFVARLKQGKKAVRIVETIIRLANALDLQVIAEGVETNIQISQLRKIGCNFGQGNWFSKPLEGSEVGKKVFSQFPISSFPQSQKRQAKVKS